MLSLDGLEMIAVLVVMGLFIKVLEQFGMFEPVGGEGKAMPFPSEFFFFFKAGASGHKGHVCAGRRVFCCHFDDFSPSLLWSWTGCSPV